MCQLFITQKSTPKDKKSNGTRVGWDWWATILLLIIQKHRLEFPKLCLCLIVHELLSCFLVSHTADGGTSAWGIKMVGEVSEGTKQYSPSLRFWPRAFVKEADKLACLVLFLLLQFHSTVRAHVGHRSQRGSRVRRPFRKLQWKQQRFRGHCCLYSKGNNTGTAFEGSGDIRYCW